MNQLEAIYEQAEVTDQYRPDKSRVHFYDKEKNCYVSIPKQDLSEKEQKLLAHFYIKVEQGQEQSQQSAKEQAWWEFLINSGKCPETRAGRVRFLYMKLSEGDRDGLYEAVATFFDHALLTVWMNEKECILIEEESDYPIQTEDALTFLDVLAGDFYIAGRCFTGRFSAVTEELKKVYKNEADTARKAAFLIPEQKVASVEMVVPHLFLAQSRSELERLFQGERQLFQEDDDLRHTLQLFIQNNLNVSQTAKQLHLHRNSLQYRIDKFIDRTSLDVRSYEGALLVYMICLLSTKNEHPN